MQVGIDAVRGALAVLAVCTFAGCITSKEKHDMQNGLYDVQTRLLTLERTLNDTSREAKSSGDTTAKTVASTKTDLDRILRDIAQLRGEVDAVKVGVTTGALPGGDPSAEGSVAASLAKVNERLDSLEQAQEELLGALQKAGLKTGAKKKSPPKVAAGSLGELQTQFNDKHYKQVVEDAPKVLKEVKGEELSEARFLVAESLFKIGKIKEAALKYSEFVEAKPPEQRLPLAKMRLGDCFRHLGDAATAKVYYEELIKEFPKSDEAAKAKERLAELDAKGGKAKTDKG